MDTRRIQNQILQLLNRERSIYEILFYQDASLPEIFNLLKEMETSGIIRMDAGKVSLTEKGMEISEKLRTEDMGDVYCEKCEGTGIKITDEFSDVLAEYREICMQRPEAIEDYDQGFVSIDGVMRRVEFIYDRGELANSRIFVVGDDDLFSIASALTGLPKEVVVVDIDRRLIDFINRVSKERGLNIKAMVYDVQQAFPDELKRKFHLFVTDPVETLPGLKLFLSRGVSTLRGVGCSGYFGITTLEASRKKWYEIQKMILDMGFVITDLKRHFNIYPQEDKNFFRFQEKLPIVEKIGYEVDYNWYNSTFYRIEAVKDPKPVVEGEMIINEKVYKDDESWATPY